MSVKIFIAGDIVNTKNEEEFIDSKIKKIIRNQDYAICNFEAPIENSGNKILKAGPNIFQKKNTIPILKRSGFNLLLLANNHIFDFGEKGLLDTITYAKKNDLDVVGAGLNYTEAYKSKIIKIKDLRICIINACELQFGAITDISAEKAGYAWINHPLLEKEILENRESVDKIIVCIHAGLENYETPLEEWKKRYRQLCDIGADCIVASHPHVPQGYEKHNGKLIFYSLGNFYFDTESFANSSDNSYSIILELKNEEIDFTPIFHYKLKDKVMLQSVPCEKLDLRRLNSLINNQEEIENTYLQAFNNDVSRLYHSIYNSYYKDSFRSFIRKSLYKIYTPKKIKIRKNVLLQHLTRNETYRYVTYKGIKIQNIYY